MRNKNTTAMAPQADFEEEAAQRDYRAPYSRSHPIPTIQRYREHREELEGRTKAAEDAQHTEEDNSRLGRAYNSVRTIIKDEDKDNVPGSPYPTANQYTTDADRPPNEHDSSLPIVQSDDQQSNRDNQGAGKKDEDNNSKNSSQNGPSATEKAAGTSDVKEKRHAMKHNKRDDGGREVTDPVTHLPLIIRDPTKKDLRRAPENEPNPGLKQKTGTGLSSNSKSSSQLGFEQAQLQDSYKGMQKMFPPPSFEDTRAELARTYQLALAVGLTIITVLATLVVLLLLFLSPRTTTKELTSKSWWDTSRRKYSGALLFTPLALAIVVAAALGFLIIFQLHGWLGKKVEAIWEDEVWDAARLEESKSNNKPGHLPESVAWLNSTLASVWPLVNPDLFASVIDMLEDVMQESLPRVIRMVSIDDLGQGSEAIRILGVRWLPFGAADKSVDQEGNVQNDGDETNDRAAPGEGRQENIQDSDGGEEDQRKGSISKKEQEETRQKEQKRESTREGMGAEQGDFINSEDSRLS